MKDQRLVVQLQDTPMGLVGSSLIIFFTSEKILDSVLKIQNITIFNMLLLETEVQQASFNTACTPIDTMPSSFN